MAKERSMTHPPFKSLVEIFEAAKIGQNTPCDYRHGLDTAIALTRQFASEQATREAFEKWHDGVFQEPLTWIPERNLYKDFGHQEAWRGWKAALSLLAPKEGETHG